MLDRPLYQQWQLPAARQYSVWATTSGDRASLAGSSQVANLQAHGGKAYGPLSGTNACTMSCRNKPACGEHCFPINRHATSWSWAAMSPVPANEPLPAFTARTVRFDNQFTCLPLSVRADHVRSGATADCRYSDGPVPFETAASRKLVRNADRNRMPTTSARLFNLSTSSRSNGAIPASGGMPGDG